ncbi:MAG: CinA family protein [Promethearchaeota archaeon]|jgi:nicotinamide-nucleotide amidase|nr:MAG: CinA family protein [Candidatus Lokiarchaeota archaeon]
MNELKQLKAIIKKFTDLKKTLAIAESCTGGYISHMITNISGASNVFDRGIVCYSNQSKIQLLNVNDDDIEKHGAVSKSVADQLAFNIRRLSNTDIGIGITGIAGPTGGTKEKPVGLVYIGLSTIEKTEVHKFEFNADRITFKKLVLEKIVDFLTELGE